MFRSVSLLLLLLNVESLHPVLIAWRCCSEGNRPHRFRSQMVLLLNVESLHPLLIAWRCCSEGDRPRRFRSQMVRCHGSLRISSACRSWYVLLRFGIDACFVIIRRADALGWLGLIGLLFDVACFNCLACLACLASFPCLACLDCLACLGGLAVWLA